MARNIAGDSKSAQMTGGAIGLRPLMIEGQQIIGAIGKNITEDSRIAIMMGTGE